MVKRDVGESIIHKTARFQTGHHAQNRQICMKADKETEIASTPDSSIVKHA